MDKPHLHLPLKLHSFAKLRAQGLIYADKTAPVLTLLTNYPFACLCRPRGSGLTLTLSLICALLENGAPGLKEKPYLLHDLQADGHWQEPPCRVLRFNFKELAADCGGDPSLFPNVLSRKAAAYAGNPALTALTPAAALSALIESGEPELSTALLIDDAEAPFAAALAGGFDLTKTCALLAPVLKDFYAAALSARPRLKRAYIFCHQRIREALPGSPFTDLTFAPAYCLLTGLADAEMYRDIVPSLSRQLSLPHYGQDNFYGEIKKLDDCLPALAWGGPGTVRTRPAAPIIKMLAEGSVNPRTYWAAAAGPLVRRALTQLRPRLKELDDLMEAEDSLLKISPLEVKPPLAALIEAGLVRREDPRSGGSLHFIWSCRHARAAALSIVKTAGKRAAANS